MPERVTVGRILKPHGIRGEVVVDLWSDVPGRLAPGTVLAAPASGPSPVEPPRPLELTVARTRPHQGRLLVTFEEVADRNGAELLRGVELRAEPLEAVESEFLYVSELLDRPVRDDAGTELGRVRDVIELPASAGYELLEVERADGTRWLLPAVDDYVEVVAEPDGVVLVLVDPPDGLVEGAPS